MCVQAVERLFKHVLGVGRWGRRHGSKSSVQRWPIQDFWHRSDLSDNFEHIRQARTQVCKSRGTVQRLRGTGWSNTSRRNETRCAGPCSKLAQRGFFKQFTQQVDLRTSKTWDIMQVCDWRPDIRGLQSCWAKIRTALLRNSSSPWKNKGRCARTSTYLPERLRSYFS